MAHDRRPTQATLSYGLPAALVLLLLGEVACAHGKGAVAATATATSTQTANAAIRQSCRRQYRDCAERCQRDNFRMLGPDVWVGDWAGNAACGRQCSLASRTCLSRITKTEAAPVRSAATPRTPGVWFAEYFGRRDWTDLRLMRREVSIEFSSMPANLTDDFAVRWTLTERLPVGDYRFVARCGGQVRLRVDGVESPLSRVEFEGGDVEGSVPVWTSGDVSLGTGRTTVLEWIPGPARSCWASWLPVDAS